MINASQINTAKINSTVDDAGGGGAIEVLLVAEAAESSLPVYSVTESASVEVSIGTRTFYEQSVSVDSGLIAALSTAITATSENVSLRGAAEPMVSLMAALGAVSSARFSDASATYRKLYTEICSAAQLASTAALAAPMNVSDAATAELRSLLAGVGDAWLMARANAAIESDRQVTASDMLSALVATPAAGAYTRELADIANSGDEFLITVAVQALDTLAAELTPAFSMQVGINEELVGEAVDGVDISARLRALVTSGAEVGILLKFADEVLDAWVMNLEGDQPFSRYDNYGFNSFAKIGNTYFASNDFGIHQLSGDTDRGEPIQSKLTTMMLDFGTTAQKRVVAAYLGYTADSRLVLKVRSVDDGRLVEHWYAAKPVTANAPRESYMQLGRGLKSRYWQFELVNEDGGDFELDKLELWPLVTNRRV